MISMAEKPESRRRTSGDNPTAELVYVLTGTSDEAEALAYAQDNAPGTYDGLVRQSIDAEPVHADSVTDSGIWTITVHYSRQPLNQIGSEGVYNFETGGGTQHITQSIATTKYPSATAPDFKGAIGVSGGNVEGVDITVPVYNWSETHRMSAATVTTAYKNTLFNLTGKVNNATWREFAAGEVLFLGASGSKRGEEEWEITFKFAASPNRENMSVGSINGVSKKGWEYFWVYYEDEVSSSKLLKQPKAVYVEQVYQVGSFSTLGID